MKPLLDRQNISLLPNAGRVILLSTLECLAVIHHQIYRTSPFLTVAIVMSQNTLGRRRVSDIFCLGNMLEQRFAVHKYSLLQFLVLLVDAMIQKEPSVRPTISEVVHRFAVLCNSLTKHQLRKPATSTATLILQRARQLEHITTFVPPLPVSKFPVPPPADGHDLKAFFIPLYKA